MLDTANTYTMAKNYSHCPLKKRPIQFAIKDDDSVQDEPMPLSPPKIEIEIADEPENLSTKPEDLSRRAAFPVKVEESSPPPLPLELEQPQRPTPISIPVPQRLGLGAFHRVAPASPEPLHYAPTTWHRSVAAAPHYPPAYFPLGYPFSTAPVADLYHHPYPLYPSPPSPYAPRDNSCSPPQLPPLRAPLALHPMSPRGAASLSPGSSLRSHSPVSEPADLSPPPPTAGGCAQTLPQVLSLGAGRTSSARHQCPDCGKSYSTFSGLSKHRQFHCAAGDAPRRSFSCKYCEKVYVSLGALKMHIRTHTLPCKCTLCGKAFSRPWLLQGHIRTHTGEKPFSCQHCHRAFADRSNLRAHLQTHSDIKKYSCPTCSKTFSRMSLLTKHAEGGCTGGSPIPNGHHLYASASMPQLVAPKPEHPIY